MTDVPASTEMEAPALELWVVGLTGLVLIGGVIVSSLVTGTSFGELFVMWAVPVVILILAAGAGVPWTRGLGRGARLLLLTGGLGALGALVMAPTFSGILLLSVIRTGMTPSGEDVLGAFIAGVPPGSWFGAAAGMGVGLLVGLVALIVDGATRVPDNPDRPRLVAVLVLVGLSAIVLALTAEAQRHAPLFHITGCSSGCSAWPVEPPGRALGSAVFVVASVLTGLVLEAGGRAWRGPVGALLLPVALVSLGLGHTTFTSTFRPRFARSTLGLPPMPLPLTREMVRAEVVEQPGALWHTVEVRWLDGYTETVVIGVGPFRPDTDALARRMEDLSAEWRTFGDSPD